MDKQQDKITPKTKFCKACKYMMDYLEFEKELPAECVRRIKTNTEHFCKFKPKVEKVFIACD